ncbi:MAG: hypothetical protein K7J15_04655, partial [Candidatus Regiella insecticola]|nr:hypothetical protein [Candidatus Regiella insecticola]
MKGLINRIIFYFNQIKLIYYYYYYYYYYIKCKNKLSIIYDYFSTFFPLSYLILSYLILSF